MSPAAALCLGDDGFVTLLQNAACVHALNKWIGAAAPARARAIGLASPALL